MNFKYLERQGEPEAGELVELLKDKQKWRHFLAIPCCGEHQLLPYTLESIGKAHRRGPVLVLLVINEGPHTKAEYVESNQKTFTYLHENYPLEELKQGILFASTDTFDLVVIDRSGEFRFPPKKGVGLARKICSDVGLALVQKGLCTSPWIHNTDGDARVPADYFLQVEKLDPKSCSASFYEFRHESGEDKDETHWQAAQLYESWLRYYRLGLQYAGSPYDFHTIGSTITINANHYSLVHGFPRREAGEDFYLLNKLAKVGKILKLEGDPIILEDRLSSRVPFGTGQGTQKIKDSIVKGEDYRVYHPIVFDCLKTYLSLVSTCILSGGDFSTMLNEISNKSIAETISNLEVDTLKAIQDATQRSKTREAALLQFHHWFDAFKTLKFIHFCRDQGMGTLMIQDAVEKSVFINGPSNNLEHLRVADSQS